LIKAVQGKDVGKHETERGVRAKVVVVVGTLVFDEESGFSEGAKPMLVEAVVAEGAIKALDEGVLHGFAWVDMMESNARGLIPEVEGLPVNSGPLSTGDFLGNWRERARRCRTVTTEAPPMEVSIRMARHWRVKSSTSDRQRKRRPVA
jgi:hypothetical protein